LKVALLSGAVAAFAAVAYIKRDSLLDIWVSFASSWNDESFETQLYS
jgi:hypothetical protein